MYFPRPREPDPPLELVSPPLTYWRDRAMDNGMPRILLWHRDATPSHDAREQWPLSCPLRDPGDPGVTWISCEVTDNRSRVEWSDAVVFQAERVSPDDMPTRRTGFQNWVLWTRNHVSPVGGSGQYLENMRDVHMCGRTHPKVPKTEFDWTMGRREDSDVKTLYKPWRCGDDVVAAASRDKIMTVADVARRNRDVLGYYGARRDAVWIVSSCELLMGLKSSVDAVKLAKALGADAGSEGRPLNVSVDLIPDCGRSTCGSRRDCLRKMAARYHFVVVATDSDCFHSPYELIYDAFEFDVVPVLLASHHETVSYPWLSVVHSVEFDGLGNMVAYLRFLESSPVAYENYLAWKESCVVTAAHDLCPLCVALNDKFYRGRVQRSRGDWGMDRRIPATCETCREHWPVFAWAFPVSKNGLHWLYS
ncbi:hypothetical protein HPB52_012738 [Rhipicephalus sanguineus]|uniref:Fucosyltransferase n=1 Tax=Rhipicephalus sanguineus TaxID=34632 RepID=A0A9D4T3T0_RHISA|nr:hypothetical protein HPB52_012738 [Rhipicephalus sanguineus]